MALTPQTQQAFLEGTLFQPPFRKRKDKGARVVAQLVIGAVRKAVDAGSILVGASFLPTIARADV